MRRGSAAEPLNRICRGESGGDESGRHCRVARLPCGRMLGPADRGTDGQAMSSSRKSRTISSASTWSISTTTSSPRRRRAARKLLGALQEIRQAAAAEDRRRRHGRRVDLGGRRRRPVRRLADRPRLAGIAQRHDPGAGGRPRRHDYRAVRRAGPGCRPNPVRGAARDRTASRREGDRAAGDRHRHEEPVEQRHGDRRDRDRRPHSAVGQGRSAARRDRRRGRREIPGL